MTTAPSAGVRLDTGQYLALWRRLGLGEQPILLAVLDHGRTHAERDALDAAAWDRLAAHGLLDDTGAPDPALADVLAVLAASASEVDVQVRAPGRPPRCLVAASTGALGVVAALDADRGLRLDPADPNDLAGALLARLPDRPAAPGVAMSVPADALLGDGVTLDQRARRLRRAGVPSHHVERLRAMWAAPPERAATFGVAARDAGGVRRRGPWITVLDTVTGRLATSRDRGRLVLRPTDRGRLRAELAGLLDAHRREVT